jgi:predicted ATPase
MPTAEAIRQAFLGRRSRVSIKEPQLPSLVVASIEVEGSTILQKTSLPLSPEFNTVIGGRGSGKSSFLEYISFGLGRSCYDVPRDHYSGTQRLHDLTNDTLVSKSGRVTLTVVQDKATFKIVRGQATAYQPQITYPNGSTQIVTVKELRTLFPAVVYSQGELAEIGKQAGKKTQLSDLLQFVNPDYKREDDRLAADIESAKSKVRAAIETLAENWSQQSKLRKLTTTRDSVRQRVEALEQTLPKRSEDDQAIVNHFDKANEFESKRLLASEHADQILGDLKASATELLNESDLAGDLEGADAIRQRYGALYKSFSEGIAKLLQEVEESGEPQPACSDLMRVFGDTERIRSALTERMDTSRVEAIAAAVPRPEIALSYCDGTREISFEKASEGQRAAALLFMLLEQPGGPLIIDQPEGDLDNKIIADLTDRLHSAKQNRQLIFASHNANIVVNGSSELVGHLDVKDSGERHFECAGAIDAPSICKVITSTMEGGERAFKDRQNKYGY